MATGSGARSPGSACNCRCSCCRAAQGQEAKTAGGPGGHLHTSLAHNLQYRIFCDEDAGFRNDYANEEETRRRLQGQLYQLLVMSAAFQGVIFTAVSQSTKLSCHDVWSPVALSAFASLATALATWDKLRRIESSETEVMVRKGRAVVNQSKMDKMRLRGTAFDLEFSVGDDTGSGYGAAGLSRTSPAPPLLPRGCLPLLSFLGSFSLLIILSSYFMLCTECKC